MVGFAMTEDNLRRILQNKLVMSWIRRKRNFSNGKIGRRKPHPSLRNITRVLGKYCREENYLIGKRQLIK
jgi:hypothetical protein